MTCRHHAVSALLLVVALSGCAAMPKDASIIPVESDPPGATVYVLDKAYGTTPLVLRHQDVFPVTYDPARQHLYGRIVLRKEGCREHAQPVSTKVYARGLSVRLDCGPVGAGQPAAPLPTTVENRLRQLKDLREQGLVTEEAAREIRQRILNDL